MDDESVSAIGNCLGTSILMDDVRDLIFFRVGEIFMRDSESCLDDSPNSALGYYLTHE
jgi:hypothetical protein